MLFFFLFQCYKSCKEIQHYDTEAVSGMYKIYPLPNGEPIEVYCELAIDEAASLSFLEASL